jgi:4-hydroxy-2-oxoheptanedioate aldolase
MRHSRVLRKIRAGGVAICLKMNLADPRAVEICSTAGFDCVWFCQEHVPSDSLVLENMIRAAKVHDVDALMRAARGSYSDYLRGFEMDAVGILVPHIMSLEDASQVVRFTKFPPIGRRAVDGGNADACYCRVDFKEYVALANDERFVLYQIEDPEPLNQLREIAELPGVDGLFFGSGDFSLAVGKPGMMNDPEVESARVKVFAAAREAGKIAASSAGVASLRKLVDQGCNFVSIGADVVGLGQYADRLIGEASHALDKSLSRDE